MKTALLWVWTLVAGASLTTAFLQSSQSAEERPGSISREVHHELVMLPQLTIFDVLAYKLNGNDVTLLGQVRNAVLKDSAERVVKDIPGVNKVDNQIEVLPASPNDDRLRLALAHAIFNDPALFRYSLGAVPPIHIIVRRGHVILQGVVDSEADKNLAGIRAKGVPGIFSVQNNLRVGSASASTQ